MQLTILGSGTLIPTPERGNSGYFLQTDNQTILIDGGSGTLRQISRFGLNYREIDMICYTHLHPDHTFDLIPLLFAYKHDSELQMPKNLKMICPVGFQNYFDRLMNIYADWLMSEEVNIEIHEIERGNIDLDGLTIQCRHTEHTDHSVTYRFIDSTNKNLFYSGDTDMCEELIESAKDVDVLLLECSFPDTMKRNGHLTPSLCGEIAAETNCKKLVLTHFYPEVLKTDIISAVNTVYNGDVILAEDGLIIKI
tara:strand:+ start:7881 stop:8636 length:756 start_codon:yes stop_codon:yes gene_type:complete